MPDCKLYHCNHCGADAKAWEKRIAKLEAIIAAHAPPDKLDELLAAAKDYCIAAACKSTIVLCLNGRGALVSGTIEARSGDQITGWHDPDTAAAAIREATEKLRPEPEPKPEPKPEPQRSCATCLDVLVCKNDPSGPVPRLSCWRPKPTVAAPPHVWRVPDENTPVDAWVWRASATGPWNRGHYAGKPGCVWGDHFTSWCADGKKDWLCWPRVVLADPAHLDRMPPADWTPDAES